MSMTKQILAMLALAPILVFAEIVELPKTPKPRFADCEESVSKPMSLWKAGTHSVTTTIECDCTCRNALRVAFGRDANKDGNFQVEETYIQFGWDAGGWVLRSYDQWTDSHEDVRVEKERRTLKVEFVFDISGKLSGFSAWDGEKRIFESLSKTLPKWLYVKDSNIVQVKRNGVDDPNERVTISISPHPADVKDAK